MTKNQKKDEDVKAETVNPEEKNPISFESQSNEDEDALITLEKENKHLRQELDRALNDRDELKRTLNNVSKSIAILQDRLKEKELSTTRDVDSLLSQNHRKIAKELLEVFDNLDRIKEIMLANKDWISKLKNKEAVTIMSSLYQGLDIVESQFKNVLKNNLEVEEIPAQKGDPIDLELHMELQAEENRELGKNTIVGVIRRGYTFRKKQLLRAVLIVANRY